MARLVSLHREIAFARQTFFEIGAKRAFVDEWG